MSADRLRRVLPRRDRDGLAFPREERAALVGSDPRFSLPGESDLRFNWVPSDLAALDPTEARELVVDAWRMVVPQKVARATTSRTPPARAEARVRERRGCGQGA